MKLFHRALFRRFSCYKEVKRPKEFKVVKRPTDESAPVINLVEAKIKAAGPITVADYMKLVLTNPLTGYYMRRDVFGEKGDFITSPEISQLFGDIIGVWIYHEWKKIGMPKSLQLVELGPGRGTLMKDVLRVLNHLGALTELSVHLVEISPHLASIQAQILCEDVVNFGSLLEEPKGNSFYRASKTTYGCPIYWYKKIENIPRSFSIILAHEFFDALPIHKYQKTSEGWREVLINIQPGDDGKPKLEYTLSKNETPISKLLIREGEKREHLEISPDAGKIVSYVGNLLKEEGGFAFFVDYGHNGTKSDTFRAFKNHQVQDPLAEPGTADLTADVDFSFLREVLKNDMLVFGPIEQGEFLLRMGIQSRLEMLLKNTTKESDMKNLQSCYHMIVDKTQMGERYKCMAVFPLVLKSHLEKYPVAGFFPEIT